MKTANKARPDAHWLCELCQLCVMLADLSIFVMPMLQFFNLPECSAEDGKIATGNLAAKVSELTLEVASRIFSALCNSLGGTFEDMGTFVLFGEGTVISHKSDDMANSQLQGSSKPVGQQNA